MSVCHVLPNQLLCLGKRTQCVENGPRVFHWYECTPRVTRSAYNRFFTASGNATITCGSTTYTLAEYHAQTDFDVGSTVAPAPPVDTVFQWARDILQMS